MKAINLVDDDELIQVRVSTVEDSAMLVTKKGLAIKFELSDIREIGRTGQGVDVYKRQTIMHGVKKIDEKIKTTESVKQDIENIKKMLED